MSVTKTLGPVSAELLLLLSAEGKSMFSIADALAITGKSYQPTAALLSRLMHKNGWCGLSRASTSSCP